LKLTLHDKLPVISIKKILTLAGDEFGQVIQWSDNKDSPNHAGRVAAALHRVEILVTTVEEFDCGSHGGYGQDQPSNQSLVERWEWLCEKYNLNYYKVKNYGQSKKTMKAYFG
jgi:hypothetical protein